MTRKEYVDLFGEDPVDMFGPDWKNIIDGLSQKGDGND